MKKRVGIIFGGNSVEHEISILSLVQANYAIDQEKYDLVKVYMTKDGHFWVGPNFEDLKTYQNDNFKHYEITFYNKNNKLMIKGVKPFLPRKYKKPIDVILPIVHGKNVEDGSLAGYFNILNVTYASSEVLAAAIFQNKFISKKLLEIDNINVVSYYYFTLQDYKNSVFEVLEGCHKLGFPLIIKPASLGSSVGIKIAENHDQLIEAIDYSLKYDDQIIVENKLVNYREFSQAILEEDEYRLSSIEEVKSTNNYLTFDDKYMPASSTRDIPALISKDLEKQIEAYSLKIANLYNPRGVIRIDYLYDKDKEVLYVNEINSIPGSLSYYLFDDTISFTSLIDNLITQAIKVKYNKGLRLTSFKSNVLNSSSILKK